MITLQFTKRFSSALPPTLPYAGYPGFEIRIPSSVTLVKGVTQTLDTGISVRIPAGYFGRLGPKLDKSVGMAVLVDYIQCQINTEVKVMVKALHDDVVLKAGEVVAILVLRKMAQPVTVLEQPDMASMVSLSTVPEVNFCRLTPEAHVPVQAPEGYLLRALFAYSIRPGERAVISTGLSFKFPEGYHGLLDATDAQVWIYNVGLLQGYVAPHSRRELRFILKNNDPTRTYNLSPGSFVAILRVQRRRGSRLVEKTQTAMGIDSEVTILGEPVPADAPKSDMLVFAPTTPPKQGSEHNEDKGSENDEDTDSSSEAAAVSDPLRKKMKWDFMPRIARARVIQIVLLFNPSPPSREDLKKIALALEAEVRHQAWLTAEAEGDENMQFYVSCVKQESGQVVTLYLTIGGLVFSRETRRLVLSVEDALQAVLEKEKLSFTYKVVPEENLLTNFC